MDIDTILYIALGVCGYWLGCNAFYRFGWYRGYKTGYQLGYGECLERQEWEECIKEARRSVEDSDQWDE